MRRLLLVVVAAFAATGALVAQQPPDRAKPPQTGAPPALTLPAIQKRQLSNGLAVWLVEQHKVPVVQANLIVFSGSVDDPAGKFGVASLTASMLEEGAGPRTSLELADAVDFLGADLTAASGTDSIAVRLHVPVARIADALPLMADVALRPTFPPEELDRLRAERLTGILQARDDPTSITGVAFPRVLYGTGHRYGTSTGGTAATIKAIGVDDLRAFYRAAFQPKNATLLVVGDTTADTLVPLLESSFGRWQAQGPALPPAKLPATAQPAARAIYLIDKPGAPQSQIRIGWIGVPRSTPDYFPIQVMNTILGGSFSARLNMNLREKNGYTYGAFSAFDMRASAGPFAANAGVQTDKTAEALTEFFNELNGIQQPVPADELTRAKNYVALRYPSQFEATSDMSRQLENMLVYHLPDDYFSKYVQNIQVVTAADVQRVAQKYIQPSRLIIVITGDRKTIEPRIRALNLGPIKIMTVDDVFGPAPVIQ